MSWVTDVMDIRYLGITELGVNLDENKGAETDEMAFNIKCECSSPLQESLLTSTLAMNNPAAGVLRHCALSGRGTRSTPRPCTLDPDDPSRLKPADEDELAQLIIKTPLRQRRALKPISKSTIPEHMCTFLGRRMW
jgi:hypothetical protein